MWEIQLGAIESRFADMIWEWEPVTSSELVKLAAVAFTWKRTTTHVDLIPVLGRNHMHICHQKILIQPFTGEPTIILPNSSNRAAISFT